ncbi:MAG: hypothetical protein ACKOWN_00415 [Microbacteriaceae bacterium]
MFVRIDPTIPIVWRDHDTAQVGIDPVRLVLHNVDDATARALGDLVKGTSTQRLSAILGSTRSAELRASVSPVLGARRGIPLPRVAIVGRTDSARVLAELCTSAFATTTIVTHSTDIDPITVDIVVLVSDFVVSPMDVQPWLGGDIDHVTVVFTESSAIIGPLVRPGVSACVTCVELDRIDHDPAWSAIAPQVWSRTAHPTRALIAHAASEVLAVMSAGSGYSTRIDGETFARVIRPHDVHPRCGCQSLPALPE